MASVAASAPGRPGSVAEGSCRDAESRPLSRPGPLTDSDSDPWLTKTYNTLRHITIMKTVILLLRASQYSQRVL